MKQRTRLVAGGVALILALLACSSPWPGATTPVPITTLVAATQRAMTAMAPTTVPATGTSTSAPPAPTQTPSAAPAARINFLEGATTGVVTGSIAASQTLTYVLQAGQGQPMLVHVDSPENDVTLSIRTQGGTSLLSNLAHQSSWKGTVPRTEDYVISLYGGKSSEQFSLTTEIASRISFAPGAESAKISGQTSGGYTVAYAVFAQEGQKMELAVYAAKHTPGLAVWGYVSNQTYLAPSSNRTSFSFTIPETQDYIIEIVPKPGETVNFVIILKIR